MFLVWCVIPECRVTDVSRLACHSWMSHQGCISSSFLGVVPRVFLIWRVIPGWVLRNGYLAYSVSFLGIASWISLLACHSLVSRHGCLSCGVSFMCVASRMFLVWRVIPECRVTDVSRLVCYSRVSRHGCFSSGVSFLDVASRMYLLLIIGCRTAGVSHLACNS